MRANRLAMALIAQIDRLAATAMIVAISMLAACTCSTSDIGSAARYSDDGLSIGSREQENRWLANPRLDSFLHRSFRSDGLRALSRRHGFQCIARSTAENCTDCYVCTATIGTDVVFAGEPFGYCGSGGNIAIRAEVGPGDAVTSMTYWTPAERPKKSRE